MCAVQSTVLIVLRLSAYLVSRVATADFHPHLVLSQFNILLRHFRSSPFPLSWQHAGSSILSTQISQHWLMLLSQIAKTITCNTSLSDYHYMVISVLKTHAPCIKNREVTYRTYKNINAELKLEKGIGKAKPHFWCVFKSFKSIISGVVQPLGDFFM